MTEYRYHRHPSEAVDDCGQQVNHYAEAIDTFCRSHNEGRGWVVKYPYVTNSEGRTFCTTVDAVFRALMGREISAGQAVAEFIMVK